MREEDYCKRKNKDDRSEIPKLTLNPGYSNSVFDEMNKESGTLEGVKFDDGKLRYDLIPVEAMREVAKVFTMGAKKYSDRNWEKGIDWGRIYAAAQRHFTTYWGTKETYDPEDGQHHLASVIWACLALMEFERTHPELDPRDWESLLEK